MLQPVFPPGLDPALLDPMIDYTAHLIALGYIWNGLVWLFWSMFGG